MRDKRGGGNKKRSSTYSSEFFPAALWVPGDFSRLHRAWLLWGCPPASPPTWALSMEFHGSSVLLLWLLFLGSWEQRIFIRLSLTMGSAHTKAGSEERSPWKRVGQWTHFQTDHKTNFSFLEIAGKYTFFFFFWCLF